MLAMGIWVTRFYKLLLSSVVAGFTFIAVVSHYLYDRFQSRAYPNEKELLSLLGWDLHAKKADISTEEVKRALDREALLHNQKWLWMLRNMATDAIAQKGLRDP